MSIVNVSPESGNWPYLRQGGKYGPGVENPAEVEVTDINPDVQEEGKGPGYDKDCEDGRYVQITYRVTQDGGMVVYIRDLQCVAANTRSRLLRYLESLGVPVDDDGNFDTDNVIGKKCILEVGPPTQNASTKIWYSGWVTDVIGI